ncbi:MucR family transcriptional regulator (plasmid) [Methylobacterium currus]|uniref:MucR family transcriptional regulator n=1 Tax=Methylobacterium currus TaxID=2051553 RepID=UPI001E40D97B|nr:MucR family transcriptional regulator [Methylobacterium currus]UHC20006.1 MucR family transcriptional regulator [Methylobacterium currus]
MDRPHRKNHDRISECTARIVMAYVAGNSIPPADLPSLIRTVSTALGSAPDSNIVMPVPDAPDLSFVASDYPRIPAPPRRLTRQEIASSINERFLICFEDGMPYRMLARHLRLFGLTPDAYRAKWGLPDDYPMMPAADLEHRAEPARQRQLGKYDRSTAKPRKTYVMKAKRQTQDVEAPPKRKAYSTDLTRVGWRRQGDGVQGVSPG